MGFGSELMGLVNNCTQSLADILLDLVPADGSAIGNQSPYQRVAEAAHGAGHRVSETDFEQLKAESAINHVYPLHFTRPGRNRAPLAHRPPQSAEMG